MPKRAWPAPLRVAAALAAGFALVNLAAYVEVRAMTHFSTGAGMSRPVNRRTPADLRLAFETVSFPGFHGLPVEAWVIPARGRGLVILFHGYKNCKSSLLPAAKEFHDMGYDALLVDFNGSGGSAGEDTSIGYHEAEVVGQAVRWAAKRFPGKKPTLYGLSMGAAAVFRAVGTQGVEAAAVIVESPVDRMLRAVGRRFEFPGVPAKPIASLLLWWGGRRLEFDGFRHNPVEYATGIKCPTLILFGDQDEYIRLAETEEIYGNLAGAKTLKVFHGIAHQSFAEVRLVEWREAVRAFMAPAGADALLSY